MTRTRVLVAGAVVLLTGLLGTGTPAVGATALSTAVNSAFVAGPTGLSAPNASTTAAQVSAAGGEYRAAGGRYSAAGADYSRAIQLSWDGSSYSDATTESFVGFPVAVPGDSTSRTIMVRNDGPTDGTLTVSIVDVELLTPTIDDDFYSDLLIDWQTGRSSIRDLESAGTTRIIDMPLPQGETTPVTIGYVFPREATSGNKSDVGERQGRFDVLFQLGGDDAEADAGSAGSAGTGTDGSSDSGGQSDAGGQSDSGAGTAADSDAAANSHAGADTNAGANANARAGAAGSANSDGSTAAAGGSGSTANADGNGSGTSSDADGGFLPRTGGAMWWMAVLGAVIAGVGAAMVRLVQRRSN
ncbi:MULTISPECIES: hypothetical protein [unclassified Brevibacterium]|uniref:hypothetical protein n=1 Tax=unclassified Brevibacterium TaxID=2614124 RepID=UPI0010F57300|nr:MULTISPECIES: hypothetical protein [unclassified Brevibacterium]MCM1012079.1 hypothetical protein [Brevibacterium sp. XM4083]